MPQGEKWEGFSRYLACYALPIQKRPLHLILWHINIILDIPVYL